MLKLRLHLILKKFPKILSEACIYRFNNDLCNIVIIIIFFFFAKTL